MRLHKFKRIILGLIITIYLGSYLLLSLQGRFEPAAIGLNGVKSYAWAPKGFVNEFKWNNSFVIFYSPLYAIDQWYWHTDEAFHRNKYSINEVANEDVWKVWEACK
jgi:hypothetical protein